MKNMNIKMQFMTLTGYLKIVFLHHPCILRFFFMVSLFGAWLFVPSIFYPAGVQMQNSSKKWQHMRNTFKKSLLRIQKNHLRPKEPSQWQQPRHLQNQQLKQRRPYMPNVVPCVMELMPKEASALTSLQRNMSTENPRSRSLRV